MENPWKKIPFVDYEKHMSDPNVGQLALLNSIFHHQYTMYKPSALVYFGIGTGNGLEHIDPTATRAVIGVDVNRNYLDECSRRFGTLGCDLQLIEADLNIDSVKLPPSDLFVANLFLEYVDLQRLLSVVKEYGNDGCVVSVVIQLTNGDSFVSPTNIQSVRTVADYHVPVNPDDVIDTMVRNRFEQIFSKIYPLPGAKEFLRLDFKMQ